MTDKKREYHVERPLVDSGPSNNVDIEDLT